MDFNAYWEIHGLPFMIVVAVAVACCLGYRIGLNLERWKRQSLIAHGYNEALQDVRIMIGSQPASRQNQTDLKRDLVAEVWRMSR